jgi:plastocyanin
MESELMSGPHLPPFRATALAALAALSLTQTAAASASERTYTLRAGPYRVANFESRFLSEAARTPRVTGWVTRMHARLVDARGHPIVLRRVMLHHVFFRNRSRARLPGACSERSDETFYGTGEENQSLDLPRGYGYRVRRSDRWWIGGMIMSHSLAARRVFVEYRVRVRTGHLRPVRPLWVRASGCGRFASYGIRGDAPAGSLDERVEHWRVPVSGRIVAAGGHLHAGAVDLRMTRPACGDQLLFHHRPAFAAPGHWVYGIRPVLHEVGPIATSAFRSARGVPVRKGELLDLHALYEAGHPRPGVMAITHIYLAPDPKAHGGCGPPPADARQTPPPAGSRPTAPWIPTPLWTLDNRLRPALLAEPPGPPRELADGATIALRENRFSLENVVVRQGDRLRWRFDDEAAHNLTFANGPRAVAGQTMTRGGTVDAQFSVAGRYQLFCYLHPMTMHQQVSVLPR